MRQIDAVYVLYHKELHIVPEELTKNRTCQTWRGRQIAMCAEREPLEKYAQDVFPRGDWYIERRGEAE